VSRRVRNTAVTVLAGIALALVPLKAYWAPALTDIGTLGGSDAYTYGLNAYGQVAGYSRITGDSEQHAFLWTPSTANGAAGTMVDLGKLGGVFSGANAINDSGHVVGMTNMPSGGDRAFLWTPTTPNATTGAMQSLGVLGNGWSSEALGVNNSNQVVGWSYYSNDPATENDQHAFLWVPDPCIGMVDLGTLGGLSSSARGINSVGQVVGWSYTSGGESHAFLWTPTSTNGTTGSMVDLGTLGGTESIAYGINTAGQVVGFASLAGDAVLHAFLWTPGGTDGVASNPQMQDLGAFGGSYSTAFAINSAGVVTGGSSTANTDEFHPFIWTPSTPNGTTGTMEDAIGLGGLGAYATGINDLGQIAGQSTLVGNPLPYTNEHAFVSAPAGTGQAPTADDQNVIVTKATNITLTGSDPQDDPLSFVIVTGPGFGTLTGTGAVRKYTPARGYTGPDSFTFKVNDGSNDSAPATVSITVAKGRQAPQARKDNVSITAAETSISIDALANDSDPNGDPLSITAVTNGKHGNATIVNIGGVYTVNYAVAGARPKKGTKDTFSYTISDGSLTAKANVTVTFK